jgi:hypothetical protein
MRFNTSFCATYPDPTAHARESTMDWIPVGAVIRVYSVNRDALSAVKDDNRGGRIAGPGTGITNNDVATHVNVLIERYRYRNGHFWQSQYR